MTLPEIVLPKVEIPFDIPLLLHPIAVHFLVALPVVVLLLELINLIMKKRAVGGVSFFLIFVTVVASVAAYLTGLNDGKAAFDALGEAAKADLSAHKLLGTYVMLASGGVLVLKLLSLTGNKILKTLYIFVLIAFVALLFKQGEEGGELVYEHGLNVEKVQDLKDTISDLKDDLADALSEVKKAKASSIENHAEVQTNVQKERPTDSPLASTGVETIAAKPQPSPSQTTLTQTQERQNTETLETKAKVISVEN